MAGSFADYLEDELLDHVLGAATFTPPVTVYAALFTVAPTDAGGGTEVSGSNYSRASITNNLTNFPASSGGAKANGTAITFATPSGSWGTVAGTLTTPASGICTFVLGDLPAGRGEGEIVVTFADASVRTYPTAAPFPIVVRSAL